MMKYLKITEERFKAIKLATENSKASNKEIGKIFSNHFATIQKVRNHATFEEYQSFVVDKERRKREAKKQLRAPWAEPKAIEPKPTKSSEEYVQLMIAFSALAGTVDSLSAKIDKLTRRLEAPKEITLEPIEKRRTIFGRSA